MINVIYVISRISLSCFSGGLLALLVNRKTGSAQGVRRSRLCIGLSFFAGLASLIAVWLSTYGLIENKWVLAGSLLGGMLWVTVWALSVEKLKIWNGPSFWFRMALGAVGVVLFFLGVELFLAYVFTEGIASGLTLCIIVVGCSVAVKLGTKDYRAEKRGQEEARRVREEEAQARKSEVERLEAVVRADIEQTGESPAGMDWDELEPILRRLSELRMQTMSEAEKKAAYERFLKENHLEATRPVEVPVAETSEE